MEQVCKVAIIISFSVSGGGHDIANKRMHSMKHYPHQISELGRQTTIISFGVGSCVAGSWMRVTSFVHALCFHCHLTIGMRERCVLCSAACRMDDLFSSRSCPFSIRSTLSCKLARFGRLGSARKVLGCEAERRLNGRCSKGKRNMHILASARLRSFAYHRHFSVRDIIMKDCVHPTGGIDGPPHETCQTF